jgi:hypothetical protein
MTSLTAVVGLVTVIDFDAVTAFAALARLAAVAAFAVAASIATAFAAVTATFATVAATALAFTAFSGASFTAFASRSAFAGFAGFFAGAFIGETAAFAMDARRFVLAEAGAASSAASPARQCEGATGAQHEKSSGHHRRETLLYGGFSGCRGGRPASRAHRPQLHSVECKRVKRGAPVAKHVGDVAQVIGEVFVFR